MMSCYIVFGGGCLMFGNVIVGQFWEVITYNYFDDGLLLRNFRIIKTTFEICAMRLAHWLSNHLIFWGTSWVFCCDLAIVLSKCVSIIVYAHVFIMDRINSIECIQLYVHFKIFWASLHFCSAVFIQYPKMCIKVCEIKKT